MTQQEVTEWARAFLACANGVGPMVSEDYALACKLRDNGRTPAYAAARIRLRIKNRALANA
jgi:hypothetical protein